MMKLASFKGTRPGIAGLFSIGCRWWLGGPYTHTELVFSDGWAGIPQRRGRVVLHKITYPADEWDLIEIDGDESPARAWFALHAGAKFDYLGWPIGFVLSRGTHEGQRWFCSSCSRLAWVP